jgi:hypothetical protein
MNRPCHDMKEWERAEAGSNGVNGLAYAKWKQLWHTDSKCEFGEMLKETRRQGYDGELN